MSVLYSCPACGQGALGPGNCPACIKIRKYVKVRRIDQQGAVPMVMVRADHSPRLPIPGFPRVESAMHGGFVLGSVTVVYGGAGLGKSTLMLRIVDRMTRILASPALYCSTEQTAEQVKLMGYRAGVADSRMLVAYETHADAVERLMTKQRFMVVDSLSNLVRVEPIVVVTGQLVEAARAQGTALVLILHETKAGDYNAPRMVEHLVDCMVRLTTHPDPGDGQPRLNWKVQDKYRFGPINRSAQLRLNDEGVPYDPDSSGGPTDGASDRSRSLDEPRRP